VFNDLFSSHAHKGGNINGGRSLKVKLMCTTTGTWLIHPLSCDLYRMHVRCM